MAIKLGSKIVGYNVAKEEETEEVVNEALDKDLLEVEGNVVHMHEKVERPEVLLGSTYKIKTPLSEHSLYITINDIVLNPDTEHEHRRPFEVFINSKNMEHFQWVLR